MTPPSYSSLKVLFKPGKYDPRCTDLKRWIWNLEKIFNAKGTPAIERPRLAFENIKEEFKSQIKFENWSEETQNGPGLITWTEFTDALVAFDREWYSSATSEPFDQCPAGDFKESGCTLPLCPLVCTHERSSNK